MPAFSLVLEILASRTIARNLMDTYLGHSAGARVLDGEIYRGRHLDFRSARLHPDVR